MSLYPTPEERRSGNSVDMMLETELTSAMTTTPTLPLPEFRFCDNGMAGGTARVEDALAHLKASQEQLETFYGGRLPYSEWGYLFEDYDAALRRWHHTVSIELGTRHGLGVCWCLVERMGGTVVKVDRRDENSWTDLVPIGRAMARAYGASFWQPDSCEWLSVHAKRER